MSRMLRFSIGLMLATTSISGVALAQDWTGPYIGLEGGFGSFDSQYEYINPVDIDLSGMLVGVEGGFNVQLDNNLVLGISGDWSFSTVKGDRETSSTTLEIELSSLATAQARIGMAVGSSKQTLIFLSGGLALGDVDLSGSTIPGGSETHVGLVVAAGAEHMLTETVSIKADVSYLDLGEKTYSAGETVKLNGVTGTVGVNLHF